MDIWSMHLANSYFKIEKMYLIKNYLYFIYNKYLSFLSYKCSNLQAMNSEEDFLIIKLNNKIPDFLKKSGMWANGFS